MYKHLYFDETITYTDSMYYWCLHSYRILHLRSGYILDLGSKISKQTSPFWDHPSWTTSQKIHRVAGVFKKKVPPSLSSKSSEFLPRTVQKLKKYYADSKRLPSPQHTMYSSLGWIILADCLSGLPFPGPISPASPSLSTWTATEKKFRFKPQSDWVLGTLASGTWGWMKVVRCSI